jgi:hypothetical protein
MDSKSLIIGALLAASPAAFAVSAPGGTGPGLIPAGNLVPALMLTADGVQVYECRLRDASGAYAWTFVAPDATLYDGNHSVGRFATLNHWESTDDRSAVTGIPRVSQPADPGNLPWLLYDARPAGEDGMFAGVAAIQRVNTSGGVAPAGGCTSDNAGEEARVAFRADYYFYKPAGA